MSGGRRITVLDTTLRDGDQSPGYAFSRTDKIRTAAFLERLGVDIIEAGFPASSQGQFDDIRALVDSVDNAAISVLARALPSDIVKAAKAIEHASRRIIHTSIATSPIHRQWKLKMTRQQIIKTAVEAVRCATAHADAVEIGAEDATRTEADFLLEFCTAVTEAGADTVNISDTVGYAQPAEFARLIKFILSHVPAFETGTSKLSVHCHNDLGLAAANTLAGIEAGASQVELTLLGIGERAGNASLEEFVMALDARGDYYHGIRTGIHAELLAEGARLLSRITGQIISPFRPVVGRNISAHGSGIHQNGIMAHPETYLLFPTEKSGSYSPRFVMTRHSGTSGLARAVKDLTGIELPSEKLSSLMEQFKTISDSMNIVGSTDIIRLLNREKITDSAIWELADFRESRESEQSSLRLEIKSSKGETLSVDARGNTIWESVAQKLNALFGYDIKCEEYSFSLVGSTHRQTGRFYLCASHNGILYHEELQCVNESILCVEAYLDIVNSIICRNSGARKD